MIAESRIRVVHVSLQVGDKKNWERDMCEHRRNCIDSGVR